jgi:(E)-4-hydroxy-3-methylbut-2-enyl-diphosphate synthase
MSILFDEHAYKKITRRETRTVTCGFKKDANGIPNIPIFIGSGHPIAVQSMTNTLTTDVEGTIRQIYKCYEAGADIMRVSVPDAESAACLKKIIDASPIPIIADIHFHYKRGIEAVMAGAACTRINPGNIGTKERAREVVRAAKDYGSSIRIGVNVGSLEEEILKKYSAPTPEALAESALEAAKVLEDLDFFNFKISVKASDVMLAVKSYELVASKCNYPLHLGVTEAGPLLSGTVKSAIGLGHLLMKGIGDTIRISLSAPPEEEIPVCWNVLKALELRSRGVNIVSCPSCARQQFDVIKIVSAVEAGTAHISKPLRISMLGCVVNGLGEAKESDIGVTGAGSGNHLIYIDGVPTFKVPSEDLVQTIIRLANEKADKI